MKTQLNSFKRGQKETGHNQAYLLAVVFFQQVLLYIRIDLGYLSQRLYTRNTTQAQIIIHNF